MRIMFVQQFSPGKGRKLPPGYVDDVPDELAMDLIRQGVAVPASMPVERAIIEPTEMRS